ncbi:MAG: oligosaccharide flippase family protein [Pseudomonadaceae bacterium]
MAALRTNILANYAGQAWIAVMGIAFMPQYIRVLGMEAFGLVGVMLSFTAILQLFDFGIGGTVNRELSRNAHQPSLNGKSRDLVRTSEGIIWALATIAALLLIGISDWLASHWLHFESFTAEQASNSIAIMGLAIALLWPSTFYANCLSGLERHLQLNSVQAVFATLRYAGVLPVMWWVAPNVEAFLWWHALVGATQSLLMGWLVWRYLPRSKRQPQFAPMALRGSSRFAGGLFFISVVAISVSQVDRFVLISLRPLEEMGYYTLALSIAAGLGRMVQPMFNALYPRFSRLVAQQDLLGLVTLYHLSSQCLAVVLAATTAVLMVFAYEVLWLWTGDSALATKVAPTLILLMAGAALNGLMNIPYALQLAHGWTRLAAGLNVASLLLGVPLCFWAVQQYGMLGAALPWFLGNLISVFIGIPLMHRRLLRGHTIRWYFKDNLPPFIVGFIIALMFHALLPDFERNLVSLFWLFLASAGTLLGCGLASPAIRAPISKWGAACRDGSF